MSDIELVTIHRVDVVDMVAREAPPMSEALRARIAQLLAAPKRVTR